MIVNAGAPGTRGGEPHPPPYALPLSPAMMQPERGSETPGRLGHLTMDGLRAGVSLFNHFSMGVGKRGLALDEAGWTGWYGKGALFASCLA